MIPIYLRLKMGALSCTAARKLLLAFVCTLMTTIPAFSQEPGFKNLSLISDASGQDHPVDLFTNVTSTIGGHVKVKSFLANNIIINDIDVLPTFSYVSRPVKLTSFTVKGVGNSKVVLTWNTTKETNSSHFTIEKSFDKKDFSDAGIVFSIGHSEQSQQYSFTDELRAGEKGIIYYRLKMVDMDGKTQRSAIKVVRIGEKKANVSILVYPNPVASDLRVTLPANWHDKKVTIDIFTSTGVLVKRFVTNKASQTETVNVRELAPGIYMIRSSTRRDSASHRIEKIR